MTVFWEIFGYIGTALVILSMTMTSITRLRLFNLAGSIVSVIYALVITAYPVVLLNAMLAAINLYHLIHTKTPKRKRPTACDEQPDPLKGGSL